MAAQLGTLLEEKAELIGRFLEDHFSEARVRSRLQLVAGPSIDLAQLATGIQQLRSSVVYSTLQGGKRFRPALAMMVAEAVGRQAEYILPFAAAVECIHTYSLIHDDLPMMDNDDVRRGQPTNHKVFGDAVALLAGDALQTEAFLLVSEAYINEPVLALRAVSELARSAGFYGMVGGQAIDMDAQNGAVIDLTSLELMHRLKTGALIQTAAVGAGILCALESDRIQQLRTYASAVGLAFQIADDLLDYDPSHPEPGNYASLLGPDAAHTYLNTVTEASLEAIRNWSDKAEPLRDLARFNKMRTC